MKYHTLLLLACQLLAWLIAPCAGASERPKILVNPIVIDTAPNHRERALLNEIDFEQIIREYLIDSRSFTVVARDDVGVQALLKERTLGDSSISRKPSGEDIGLDITSYFLIPTITKIDVSTTYREKELTSKYFDRTDRYAFAMAVRVLDSGGNTLFEESVEFDNTYGPVENNIEQRQANKPNYKARSEALEKMRTHALSATENLVNRINPITVVAVKGANIIIDRGFGNGFEENSRFKLLATEVFKHPTTDEDIKSTIEVGEAEVAVITESSSTLKMITGDLSDITPGTIARIIQED